MSDVDPEKMSTSELKQYLQTKLRVRTDACFERSDLVKLFHDSVSGAPVPARATPRPAAAATARPPARTPTPSTSAGSTGGNFVNGRYVPPPQSLSDQVDLRTAGIALMVGWFIWNNMGAGGGGGDYDSADQGEYDEDGNAYFVTGRVRESRSYQDFSSTIQYHGHETGLPVVVDFFSHSCGPCRQIAPMYQKLAKDYAGRAVFIKVDVQRNQEAAQAAGVRAMPTFQFFWLGRKRGEFSGADPFRLQQTIERLAEKAEDAGTYVDKELSLGHLQKFYTKHDAEKLEAAPETLAKYQRKTAKLMHALHKKYDATPKLVPKGTAEKAAKAETQAPLRPSPGPAKAETQDKNKHDGDKSKQDQTRNGAIGATHISTAALQEELRRRAEEAEEAAPSVFGALPDSGASAEKVIVVGGGPAGLAAALYAARAGLLPLVVAPAQGGQLQGKGVDVENYPGVVGAMVDTTGNGIVALMRRQAASFGARFADASVTTVDFSTPGHLKVSVKATPQGLSAAQDDAETTLVAQTVVIATGANSRWLGVPGEHEMRGGGVSSCATCDGFLFRALPVVVVGGGDTACEDALVLARTSSHVTLLHRRKALRASHILAERVLQHPNITVRWDTVVEGFRGDAAQGSAAPKLLGVSLKNLATGTTEEMATSAAFVAIGHDPNSNMLNGQLELDGANYIVPSHVSTSKQGAPKHGFTATSADGVFAAGDVVDAMYRQAITSAGSGAMAALDAERYLSTHSQT